MNSKLIAVIAAAVIVVAAIAAFVVLTDKDDSEEKKGWYMWDPVVGDVNYTKISITPEIVDAIENMYTTTYGDLPSKITDIPANGMISYTPLGEDTGTGISIKSKGASAPVTFTTEEISNMKIISYSSGITDTYSKLLGDDVWNTVVAAGNSTWTKYTDNSMINWSSDATGTLGSEYTLSTENLLGYLSKADAANNGNTYCILAWGYIKNYSEVSAVLADNGYDNVKVVCIDYYAISEADDLGYFLSVIDLLGKIVGVNSDDNTCLSDIQQRLYSITESLKDETGNKTVYMETAAKKSPGYNTLAQLCFDILKLKNINNTEGTQNISDEIIVSNEPSVIFFTDGDSRTMDQKMRITV